MHGKYLKLPIFIFGALCFLFSGHISADSKISAEAYVLVDDKQICVKGTADHKAQNICVRAENPRGETFYINQIESNKNGEFAVAISLRDHLNGEYKIYIADDVNNDLVSITQNVDIFKSIEISDIHLTDQKGNNVTEIRKGDKLYYTFRAANNSKSPYDINLYSSLIGLNGNTSDVKKYSFVAQPLMSNQFCKISEQNDVTNFASIVNYFWSDSLEPYCGKVTASYNGFESILNLEQIFSFDTDEAEFKVLNGGAVFTNTEKVIIPVFVKNKDLLEKNISVTADLINQSDVKIASNTEIINMKPNEEYSVKNLYVGKNIPTGVYNMKVRVDFGLNEVSRFDYYICSVPSNDRQKPDGNYKSIFRTAITVPGGDFCSNVIALCENINNNKESFFDIPDLKFDSGKEYAEYTCKAELLKSFMRKCERLDSVYKIDEIIGYAFKNIDGTYFSIINGAAFNENIDNYIGKYDIILDQYGRQIPAEDANRQSLFYILSDYVLNLSMIEKNCETYFSISNDTTKSVIAHSVINPNEGTIELTLNVDRPVEEILGTAWNFVFSTIGAKGSSDNDSYNVLSLFMPPYPDTNLSFITRNPESTVSYTTVRNIQFVPNRNYNIALTWSKGSLPRMYIDGILSAVGNQSISMNEDYIPYEMTVNTGEPFRVSQMKISSKATEPGSKDSNPSNDFIADENTTMLATNNFSKIAYLCSDWQKKSEYTCLVPVWRAEKQIYNFGENVVYPVFASNFGTEGKLYEVEIEAKDTDGKVYYINKKIYVNNDAKRHIYEIELPELNSVGLYQLSTDIFCEGEITGSFENYISVLPADDGDISDGRLANYYGMEYNENTGFGPLKKMNARTTRNQRVFAWYNVEPQKGLFSWQKSDEYVNLCEQNNIDILAVLGKFPVWAAKEPTSEEKSKYYLDEKGEISLTAPERWKPNDLSEWENYVYQVVSRYKGRVKYWEIINEANFHPPYKPASFSGTTEEYLELLAAAYSAAKKADPDCVILTSGFAVPIKDITDSAMPLELTDFKYSSGYYDYFNVHGYSGTGAFEECIENLKKNNHNVKYWMSEYMPYREVGESAKIRAEITNILDFAASGYERYIDMGLRSNVNVFLRYTNKSPLMTYHAVSVLNGFISKCDSFVGKTEFDIDSSCSCLYTFKRTDGKYFSVVVANNEGGKEIKVIGNIAELYDELGRLVGGKCSNTQLEVGDNREFYYIVSDSPVNVIN